MRPRPPAAVVFDMDGVLIDSEAAWRQVEDDYLRRIAPGYEAKHHAQIVGLRLRDLHALVRARFGATVGWDAFRAHYDAAGQDVYGRRTRLLRGARRTLTALHGAGIPLGLASSSPHAWIGATLERFDLKRFFGAVVSGEDVPRGKPAPDVYLRAAQGLGVAPGACWAVEDADVGLAAAKAAGMTAFGLRNGDNAAQTFERADAVIDALDALLERAGLKRAPEAG